MNQQFRRLASRAWVCTVVVMTGCSGCDEQTLDVIADHVSKHSQLVEQVELLPSRGNVIDLSRNEDLAISVRFVHPVERSSIDRSKIAIQPPVPYVLYFDDDPTQQSVTGSALSLVVDLDEAALVRGTRYSLVVNQPGLKFAGDGTQHPLKFSYPFEVAAVRAGVRFPHVVKVKPGPPDGLEVPGWNVPIDQSHLQRQVSGEAEQYVHKYLAPHGEVRLRFSAPLRSLSYATDPPDVGFLLGGTDAGQGFTEASGRSFAGLPPGKIFTLVILSRDSAGVLPGAAGTQSTDGKFLEPWWEEGLDAELSTQDPDLVKPGDISFQYEIASVMIVQPKYNQIVGAKDLVTGPGGDQEMKVRFIFFKKDPQGISVVKPMLQIDGSGPNLTSLQAFEVKLGGAGGRITKVAPFGTIADAWEAEMTIPVQPGLASREMVLTLQLEEKVSASDPSGAPLGEDNVEFTLDLVPPTLQEAHTAITDECHADKLIDRICVETTEELSAVQIVCDGLELKTVPVTDPPKGTVYQTYVYCFHDVDVSQELAALGKTQCANIELRGVDLAGNIGPILVNDDYKCRAPSKHVALDGRRLAIAVDAHDRVHVAYVQEGTEPGVYYAHWSTADATQQGTGGAWVHEAVHCLCGRNPDTRKCKSGCDNQYGLNVGLALDQAGTPGVCFVHGPKIVYSVYNQKTEHTAPTDLLHVRWRTGATPGNDWPGKLWYKKARYFHCALANVGLYADPDYPGETVVFAEATGKTTSRLSSYSRATTGSWNLELIHPLAGQEASLVTDAAGQLHLAFTVLASDPLKLYYTKRFKGGPWRAPQTTGALELGRRPSLALDAQGKLVMSFWQEALSGDGRYMLARGSEDTSGDVSWTVEPVLSNSLFGSYSISVADANTGNAGGLAYLYGIYAGNASRVAPAKDGSVQVVLAPTKMAKPAPSTDRIDLGQLIVATRSPAGAWRFSNIDGRVEGLADLAVAQTSQGRLQVLFHNGLDPNVDDEGERKPGHFGSLQFWQSESRSALWINSNDVDSGGTRGLFPAQGKSCVAALHHRQDSPDTRITEAQLNLRPETDPGKRVDFFANPNGPTETELVALFERIRRYEDVSGLPKPPQGGWENADTVDDKNNTIKKKIVVDLGELLRQRGRLHAHLLTPGGFLPRFNVHWALPVQPQNLPTSLVPVELSQPWAEDLLGGLTLRSDANSPLVKKQHNVCVPQSCTLQSSSWKYAKPGIPPNLTSMPAMTRAIAAWGPKLDLDAAAKDCQADGAILVLYPAGNGKQGCYRCPPDQVLVSAPGLSEPACQLPCAGGQPPAYRRAKDNAPYVTCLSEGCEDNRCVADRCEPATFVGPAGHSFEPDEEWWPLPGTRHCVRCPEGTKRYSCETGCPYDHVCRGGICMESEWTCTTDRDCDVGRGIGCGATINGTDICAQLTRCAKDQDCDKGNGECVEGLCRQSCVDPWECPSGQTCSSGTCILKLPELPIEQARTFQCQPQGCTTCVQNAYCLVPQLFTGDISKYPGAIFCPLGHTCVMTPVNTPPCPLRPLLNDRGLATALQMAPGSVGELTSFAGRVQTIFSSIKASGMDDISLEEKFKKGSLRFVPDPDGPRGSIAVVLEFQDSVTVSGSCEGCTGSASVSEPAILRVRLEPYTYEGQVHVTPVDVGVYHYVDDKSPASVEGDWQANLAADCKDMDLQGEFGKAIQKAFSKKTQVELARGIDEILGTLTRSMPVGGWLFGREQALDELDLARDDVIPGLSHGGDSNPADEVQRLYIPPSGWAAIDYLER